MARKNSHSPSTSPSNNETKVRGKRKPTEYRFETVDSEGNVEALAFTLAHQDSAKKVLAFLNSLPGLTDDGTKFRFTKVIMFQ